jgi:Protein of unknown function (DUF2911)
MKTINKLLPLLMIAGGSFLFGQDNLPRLSPKSFVGQTIGYTNLEITYGSPGTKGRDIWGELVPFGKVWRTGANEATTIEFDKNVVVEGKKIASGKYSLFTIPNKDFWTIILNNTYDQWGAYKYDQNEDVLRFTVKPILNQHVERLSYKIEYKEPYKSNINIEWEKLKISFEINSNPKD